MTRRTARLATLVPGLFLLAGLVVPAGPASGIDSVTRTDGVTLEGSVEYRPRYARLRSERGGLHRIPWDEVASLRVTPDGLHAYATDEEREALRAELAERRGEAETPDDLCELARWCREHGLEDAAASALDEAVEEEPFFDEARTLREELLEGDRWRPAGEIVRERLEAAGQRTGRRYEVARWAARQGFPRAEEQALRAVLELDAFHEDALEDILPHTADHRPRIRMDFPLRGRWMASEDPTHHHRRKKFALHALDFVKVDEDGEHHEGRGRDLEDHHAFDEPVYAVAPGRVMVVRGDFPDNDIGEIADWEEANLVAIHHEGGEYSMYVHLRRGTIEVEEGDEVERGQLIGRIGNSGASAVPHLHFAINDQEAISLPFWFRDYRLLIDEEEVEVEVGRPREGQTFLIPEE